MVRWISIYVCFFLHFPLSFSSLLFLPNQGNPLLSTHYFRGGIWGEENWYCLPNTFFWLLFKSWSPRWGRVLGVEYHHGENVGPPSPPSKESHSLQYTPLEDEWGGLRERSPVAEERWSRLSPGHTQRRPSYSTGKCQCSTARQTGSQAALKTLPGAEHGAEAEESLWGSRARLTQAHELYRFLSH